MTNCEIIINRVGEAAIFENLAEECTELAQAALKYARYLRGENPVDSKLSKEEISMQVYEEWNDVELIAKRILNIESSEDQQAFKTARWLTRLS